MNTEQELLLLDIAKKAKILMEQIYKMDSNAQYRTAFVLLKQHGIEYIGPTIYREGADLNSLLYKLEKLQSNKDITIGHSYDS